eukprot:scaffold11045_cov65-Phaeocystis_antarctica.AAC.1
MLRPPVVHELRAEVGVLEDGALGRGRRGEDADDARDGRGVVGVAVVEGAEELRLRGGGDEDHREEHDDELEQHGSRVVEHADEEAQWRHDLALLEEADDEQQLQQRDEDGVLGDVNLVLEQLDQRRQHDGGDLDDQHERVEHVAADRLDVLGPRLDDLVHEGEDAEGQHENEQVLLHHTVVVAERPELRLGRDLAGRVLLVVPRGVVLYAGHAQLARSNHLLRGQLVHTAEQPLERLWDLRRCTDRGHRRHRGAHQSGVRAARRGVLSCGGVQGERRVGCCAVAARVLIRACDREEVRADELRHGEVVHVVVDRCDPDLAVEAPVLLEGNSNLGQSVHQVRVGLLQAPSVGQPRDLQHVARGLEHLDCLVAFPPVEPDSVEREVAGEEEQEEHETPEVLQPVQLLGYAPDRNDRCSGDLLKASRYLAGYRRPRPVPRVRGADTTWGELASRARASVRAPRKVLPATSARLFAI